MVIHLTKEQQKFSEPIEVALCDKDEEGDGYISLSEALSGLSDRFFNCVECQKIMTEGQRHSTERF